MSVKNLKIPILFSLCLMVSLSKAAVVEIIEPDFEEGMLKTNVSPLKISYIDGNNTLDTSITLKPGNNLIEIVSGTDDVLKLSVDFRKMLTFTRNFPVDDVYFTNKEDFNLSYSILFEDSLGDISNEEFIIPWQLENQGENSIVINERDEYGNFIEDNLVAHLDSRPPEFELPSDWIRLQTNLDSNNLSVQILPIKLIDPSELEEVKTVITYYMDDKPTELSEVILFGDSTLSTSLTLPQVDSFHLEVRFMDKATNDTTMDYSYKKDISGPVLDFDKNINVNISNGNFSLIDLKIRDSNPVDSATVVFYPQSDSLREEALEFQSADSSYSLKSSLKLTGQKFEFVIRAKDKFGNSSETSVQTLAPQSTEFEWRNKASKKWHLIGFPRPIATETWHPDNKSEKSYWKLENNKFVFHEEIDNLIKPGQGFLWGSWENSLSFKDDWWYEEEDSVDVVFGWNIISIKSSKIQNIPKNLANKTLQLVYRDGAPSLIGLNEGDSLKPFTGYLYYNGNNNITKVKFSGSEQTAKLSYSEKTSRIQLMEQYSGYKVYIDSKENIPYISLPQMEEHMYIVKKDKKWLQHNALDNKPVKLILKTKKNIHSHFVISNLGLSENYQLIEAQSGKNVLYKDLNLLAGTHEFLLINNSAGLGATLTFDNLHFNISPSEAPNVYKLYTNFPENILTSVGFELLVYNTRGQKVDQKHFIISAPKQLYFYDAASLPRGNYFYTLRSGIFVPQPFQKLLVNK